MKSKELEKMEKNLQELSDLEGKVNDKAKQLMSYDKALKGLAKEIKELEGQKSGIKTAIFNLNADKYILKEELEKLRNKAIVDNSSKKKELDNGIARLKGREDAFEEEKKQFKIKQQSAKSSDEALTEKQKSLTDSVYKAETAKTKYLKKESLYKSLVEEEKLKIKSLDERIVLSDDGKSEVSRLKNKYNAKLEEVQSEKSANQKTKDNLSEERNLINEEKRQLDQQRKDAQVLIRDSESKSVSAQNTLENSKKSIDELIDKQRVLDNTMKDITLREKFLKNEHLVISALARKYRVEEEYEKQIAKIR